MDACSRHDSDQADRGAGGCCPGQDRTVRPAVQGEDNSYRVGVKSDPYLLDEGEIVCLGRQDGTGDQKDWKKEESRDYKNLAEKIVCLVLLISHSGALFPARFRGEKTPVAFILRTFHERSTIFLMEERDSHLQPFLCNVTLV